MRVLPYLFLKDGTAKAARSKEKCEHEFQQFCQSKYHVYVDVTLYFFMLHPSLIFSWTRCFMLYAVNTCVYGALQIKCTLHLM